MATLNYGKKMKLMIAALERNACNVSHACKAIGICRQTHYDWLDKSDKYKKEFEEVQESLIDFGESALMKNIKKGNVTAQIFFLKTKGRSRGYIEKSVHMNMVQNSASDDFDLSKLSNKELLVYEMMLEKVTKGDDE